MAERIYILDEGNLQPMEEQRFALEDDVALRVEALSEADRERCRNFRDSELRGEDSTPRRWIEAAVFALHDVERLRARVR